MNVNLTLLRNHILRNDIQICKRLMHKSGNVICPLQNFRINIAINKVKKLIKHFLNIGYLIQVSHYQRMLRQKFLLLFFKPLFKLILNFHFLIL